MSQMFWKINRNTPKLGNICSQERRRLIDKKTEDGSCNCYKFFQNFKNAFLSALKVLA